MPRKPELDGQRLVAATRLKRNELRVQRAIDQALNVHRRKAFAAVRTEFITAAIVPGDPFDLVVWGDTVDQIVLPVIGRVLSDIATAATSFLNLDPTIRSTVLGQIDVGSRTENIANKVKGLGQYYADRISQELTIGAAKGESFVMLGDRLSEIFDIGKNDAGRIARTETHGASEAMSHDSAGAIATAGITVMKTWVATADEHTRESHQDADGQEVAIDDSFEVGDSLLLYPGDPDGPADETINCRCTTTYNIPEG